MIINLSKNQKKPIQHKLLHSSAIIHKFLLKNVDTNDIDFNINYILKYYCYLFLFKVINQNFCSPLLERFCRPTHSHNTRNRDKFCTERYKVSLCRYGLQNFGPQLWNQLLQLLHDEKNFLQFSKELHLVLVSLID